MRSRYALYMWWFKFLRLAAQDPNRTIDWSKYEGWGDKDAILNQRFESWWKDRWRDLFAVQREGDTARFEISNRKARAEAIRVAYLVYTHRNVGKSEEVYVYLQKHYPNLLSLDEGKVLETKYVNQHVKRYMRQAEKLLDDVCIGRFG